MATIDLARSLYSGSRSLAAIAGPKSLAVNMRGPNGEYLSDAHKKAARASSSNNCAKISYAAVVLEYILTGRIAVLQGTSISQVYTELHTAEGGIEMAYFNNTKVFWKSEPTNSSHLCVPFVLFALQEQSEMRETKSIFADCAAEFATDGFLSEENIYKFCDAFYYEWKNLGLPSVFTSDNNLYDDVIKQAVRTGALQSFTLFDELDIATPDISVENVTKTAKTAPAVMSEGAMFRNCQDGRYVLDYCWNPDQTPNIPSLSKLESFVPNKKFFSMVELIHSELSEVLDRMDSGSYGIEAIGENYVNIILTGKPGTGKTTLANALGATFGMPVRVVAPNKRSEEDVFTGMTKVSEGGFKFFETPFLDAYKNGGILLVEEFNLADPAILMGALGQAIEKPFILYEDGYREVRRHPLCVIISTMNCGTQGSREPSEAFTSRSPDCFMLDDPAEEEFINILNKRGYPLVECKKVYKAYSKIIEFLQKSNCGDVAMSLTMRHCFAALRRICKYKHSFKEVISDTLIGSIAIKDVELAKETYKAVVEPMKY